MVGVSRQRTGVRVGRTTPHSATTRGRTHTHAHARSPALRPHAQAFSLLEKRHLGKFLQFCLDLHTAQMGGDVESRNEEGLGQSRSLTR